MNQLEKKFGKYAIKNLSLILVGCYAVGYILDMMDKSGLIMNYLTLNPYEIFMHGQVWRIVTWILIPPESFGVLTVISLFFYYSIGRTLERTWGDWLYNVYIFSGMIFTFIAVTLIYVYYMIVGGDTLSIQLVTGYGTTVTSFAGYMSYVSRVCISTYYVNMSIFLAFAATFPDIQVLLMFVIPVKVKYLGYVYAALLAYECFASNSVSRVIIIASLLNFVVFYLLQRRKFKGSPRARVKQAVRRHEFKQEFKRETSGISKHKCAICGRTEKDGADLEFRFCSKCNGNYEYCREHLFSHKHVE